MPFPQFSIEFTLRIPSLVYISLSNFLVQPALPNLTLYSSLRFPCSTHCSPPPLPQNQPCRHYPSFWQTSRRRERPTAVPGPPQFPWGRGAECRSDQLCSPPGGTGCARRSSPAGSAPCTQECSHYYYQHYSLLRYADGVTHCLF